MWTWSRPMWEPLQRRCFGFVWEPAMPAMGPRLNRSVGFSPMNRLPHVYFADESAPTFPVAEIKSPRRGRLGMGLGGGR
jgi:hypothetical protein